VEPQDNAPRSVTVMLLVIVNVLLSVSIKDMMFGDNYEDYFNCFVLYNRASNPLLVLQTISSCFPSLPFSFPFVPFPITLLISSFLPIPAFCLAELPVG